MAAGVTLDSLAAFVSADKLIRIMPNTPVAIGQGMTTYSLVNQELAPLLEQILEKSGKVQQVPESPDRRSNGYRRLRTSLCLSDD